MNNDSELAFFCMLIKQGSLVATARELNLTPPAVSRRLAQLEERLGVRLLNRTTRRISLTSEGEVYFQNALRILSDIDVQQAMKEKLGKDMPPYRILGACNPPLAHKAIQAEPNVGLLLPCNVTVRDLGTGEVIVGFLNPDMMVGLTNNLAMREVAEDASARLHRVCDALT